MTTIDVDSLVAIDMHVHVEQDGHGCLALDQELLDASAKYFKSNADRTPTVERLAEHYRGLSMAAVIFTVDATTALGHPALSSFEIADAAAQHGDVLIPFGSVDPHQVDRGGRAGPPARRRPRRPGLQVPPDTAGVRPQRRAVLPDLRGDRGGRVPAVFHTGQTGIGAGLPGGRGLKLRYSQPMLLDDVAADFPALTVILAHPSVPWQDEAISMATHKANVFIDLSGWSPKYFPPQLVRAARSYLSHKVMFGSDYPVIDPERWMGDFAELEFTDEVRAQIVKDNAARRPRPPTIRERSVARSCLGHFLT